MDSKKAEVRLIEIEGNHRKNIYDDRNGKDNSNEYIEGHSTIGYGHLIKDKEEFAEIKKKYPNSMTQEEAFKFKQKDLKEAEKVVKKYIKVPLTQNEYDALVMRAFNCGPKGFRENDDGRDTGKSKEMTDYINAGKDMKSKEFTKLYQGKRFDKKGYVPGIEIRRIMELDILQNNDYHEHDMKDYHKRRIYGPTPKKSKK